MDAPFNPPSTSVSPRDLAGGSIRWKAFGLLVAADLMLLLIYRLAPAWRPRLFGEDGVVESASALFFFLAFAVGMVGWWRTRPTPRFRLTLPLLSALGLLACLDELSFGARENVWTPPPLYGGGEFDGIHDLVILGYRLLAERSLLLPAVVVAFASLGVAALVIWRSPRLRALARRLIEEPGPRFVAVAVALVGAGAVIDLDVGWLTRLASLEELVEMNGALFFMLGTGAMARQRARPTAAATRA